MFSEVWNKVRRWAGLAAVVVLLALCLGLLVAFYTVGYLGINRLNAYRGRYFDVSFRFEKDIPFVPEMIFGYSLVFVLVAILFLVIDNMPDFRDVCRRFLLMTLFCFAVFLILPVRMNSRPEVDVTGGWITALVGFYFWLDQPYNLFPSMHLAASYFSAFFCLRKGPVIGWITMAMATIVGVSVVLLKQHYILDVMAGFTVAWACAQMPIKSMGIGNTWLGKQKFQAE